MYLKTTFLYSTFALLFNHVWSQQALLPRPNGTYTVGLMTFDLIDTALLQPFAPNAEPRTLALSIFYPTDSTSTTLTEDMPPGSAAVQDQEYGAPNGTFESLRLQLASNNSQISSDSNGRKWPVLLFSGAAGTTRLMYNSMAAQVASSGYVVVSFDTLYDTDVVELLNGSVITVNETLQENEAYAITAVNSRAEDATFILDQLTNDSLVSSLISGCNECLNLTHVGMFGHSIGGAAAATAMVNETRIAGGLNFDGALWGDVVDKGLERPFMLMGRHNDTRASNSQPSDPLYSWFKIWPKLTSSKFDFLLNNSLHYTYSDLPLVLETLGIVPNATFMESFLITNLNGTRGLHIVTSYTTAFFDFVLQGKASDLLKGASPLFPEITIDDSPDTASNMSTSSGSAASSTASSTSDAVNFAELWTWKGGLCLVAGMVLLSVH